MLLSLFKLIIKIPLGILSWSLSKYRKKLRRELLNRIKEKSVEKILVIMPSAIGDFAMASILLSNIKRTLPNSQIDIFISNPKATSLLDPNIVNKIFHNNRIPLATLYGIKNLSKLLTYGDYELALYTPHHKTFRVYIILLLKRIRYVVGPQPLVGKLLNSVYIQRAKEEHMVDYYIRLLREAGLASELKFPLKLRGNVNRDTEVPVLGLHPGCKKTKELSRWGLHNFLKLAEMFHNRYDGNTLIFVGPQEEELEKRIRLSLDNRTYIKIVKKPLKDIMSYVRICDIFVSNDSGIMHLAWILNIPTIGIYGPTDHIKYGPYGPKTRAITHNFNCSPCYRVYPKKTICIYGKEQNPPCLTSITPEEVFNAINEYLEK